MGNYWPLRTRNPTLTRSLHDAPLWLKFGTKFEYRQQSHPKNIYTMEQAPERQPGNSVIKFLFKQVH